MKQALIFIAIFLPIFALTTQGGAKNIGTPVFVLLLVISYFASKFILKYFEDKK